MEIIVSNSHGVQFWIEVLEIPESMRKYRPFGFGYREYPVSNTAEQIQWFYSNVQLPEGMQVIIPEENETKN
jgi:hypothetical protein